MEFVKKLLRWYAQNKRELPWRGTRDPYKIWISEVILQQTRIAQGTPYYHRFVEKFPSLQDLANATEEQVLQLWQGLGYYSRGVNLLICAKILHRDYNGLFPQSFSELSKLKGIGRYTAAAIASICFGQQTAVVDGNVYRALSRYFGRTEDIASTQGRKLFQELADSLIPRENPGEYNQAIMEFGALQCIPKSPDCSACPLSTGCYAYNRRMQSILSVRTKRKKPKTRRFYYFVLSDGPYLLMRRRIAGDIWKGLWDFMLVEAGETEGLQDILAKIHSLYNVFLDVRYESDEYRHALTHQKICARFNIVSSFSGLPEKIISDHGLVWVNRKKIEELPKPVLISRFLNDEFFS